VTQPGSLTGKGITGLKLRANGLRAAHPNSKMLNLLGFFDYLLCEQAMRAARQAEAARCS
jgi:hypothetical protein